MRYLLTILLLCLMTGCVYEPYHRDHVGYGYVNAAEPVDHYRVVQTFTGPMEVPVYNDYDDTYYRDPYYYGPVVRGDVHVRINLFHRNHHGHHHERCACGHHGGWHHK